MYHIKKIKQTENCFYVFEIIKKYENNSHRNLDQFA